MHTDLNKTKLTLVHILVVLILISVWTELLVGESFMNWSSSFSNIDLPSLASQNQIREGISSATLSLNGDVEISADNSTAAQLSSAGDTLVTEYKLTFDGGATGGTDTDYQTYNGFLTPAVRVTYVTDDNDVVVTLHVKASNYANDLANAGTYTATQTLTVHWVGP
ncbi:MAG: hypothetical protein NTX52_01185 [Planctomycetota bacterium]|nr:hypothetical protein [Planctomycetota bacterium]